MNEELIKEVFSDEAYVKSLFESESWEAAQASLKERGIDLSIEELKQLVDLMQKKTNDELSEDELENVSGGITFSVMVTLIAAGAATVLTAGGFALAASI